LRFDLADEAEIARVAYAEHAALAFVIVLRRVQQRAVRREHTVTCEVPSRGRLERKACALRGEIEHEGLRAGPAREEDRALRIARIERTTVRAHRNSRAEHASVRERQAADVLIAARIFEA